jgi:hypothetical protein
MYVRPRCLELAAATIADRMSGLGSADRVRLVDELAHVIEETISRWVAAERHNHDLAPLPDDSDRRRRRDGDADVPRRFR